MTRVRKISSLLVLAACGGAPSLTPTNIVVGASSAQTPLAVEDAGAPRATVTCPVVPLRLVLASPQAPRELTMLTLGHDGAITSTMLGAGAAPIGHLDDRGCIVMKSEVVVDASTPKLVWSTFSEFPLEGDRMKLAHHRAMEVGPRGQLAFYDRGVAETGEYGTFRFEGFTPAATCAARAMLALYFSMMPSMAFSDGNPKPLPPPAGSKCTPNR